MTREILKEMKLKIIKELEEARKELEDLDIKLYELEDSESDVTAKALALLEDCIRELE